MNSDTRGTERAGIMPAHLPGMNEIYVLVADRNLNTWIIPVPDGMEEDAFREVVEKETGLTAHGIAYMTTLSQPTRRRLSR